MSLRRADDEAGYVLHTRPYRETSLIVEAFTRSRGRVALVARGARRPRSSMRGQLLAFRLLRLSWSARGELGTLRCVEWGGAQAALAGTSLMCGFYLNELVLRLVPRDDPHEALFDAYGEAVHALARGEDPEAVLRPFEHRLLVELGYAPLLEHEAGSGLAIDALRRYRYDPERGPLPAANGAADTVLGQTLLDLARGEYRRAQTRDEVKRLLRELIAYRLGGRPLHTREILRELLRL